MDGPSIQIILLDVLEVPGRNSAQDLVNLIVYAILLQVFEKCGRGVDREIVEDGNVFVLKEYFPVLVSVNYGLLSEKLADPTEAQIVELVLS